MVTGRAKASIRKSLRGMDRDRFVRLGRELARVAFEHIGRKSSDKALATAAKQLRLKSVEDLLAMLGSAELQARDVITALYPENATTGAEIDKDSVVVGLKTGQDFLRAQCCQPVPGERIVGITYKGRGVMVHTIDCDTLAELGEDSSRWVDLHWHSGQHPAIHNVSVLLTISNDAGVLGRICSLIGEQKANISDLKFLDRKPDFFRLKIDIDLRDLEHLHAIMLTLEADSDVAELRRFRDLTRKP